MLVLSQAGKYRQVARFTKNTMELVLEKLEDGEWAVTEGAERMTIGPSDFWALVDAAEDAWKDYWG
jgi:hypothetical protein